MPATYEPIATTTLGSATPSITFSSIASTYTDLRVAIVATSDGSRTIWLRFNADTANNYSVTELYADGASAASLRQSNFSAINLAGAANLSTTIPHLYSIDVFSYTGSTNKTVLATKAGDQNGSGYSVVDVGLWRNTAAITSLTLQCGNGADNFKIGSTFTLYGIKNA
jgi:hypothetical protein